MTARDVTRFCAKNLLRRFLRNNLTRLKVTSEAKNNRKRLFLTLYLKGIFRALKNRRKILRPKIALKDVGPVTTQNLVVKFDGEICGGVLVENASDDLFSQQKKLESFLPNFVRAATLQKRGSENFLRFSLPKVSWNLAWNFGEIFRATFSRVWVCDGKFHQNFTSKTVRKNGKFHANFTLPGRGAETSPEVRHQFRRKLRQLHSENRWCLKNGLETFVGVLEGLKKRKSTLVGLVVGAFVGDLVGALAGPLVGPLVVPPVDPLVGRSSLSPALCVAHFKGICRAQKKP